MTTVSVVIAVAVGGVEVLGLVGERFELQGRFWDAVGRLDDGSGVVGACIIGVFAAGWAAFSLFCRTRRPENDAAAASLS